MSLFRTLLAAAAAIAIASPVFADDAAATTQPEATAPAAQTQAADATAAAPATTEATEAKVNVNSATAKELMKVKGLNASKARAIVNYRKKHGNFKSLDELSKVKGLHKLNADAMKSIEDQLEI